MVDAFWGVGSVQEFPAISPGEGSIVLSDLCHVLLAAFVCVSSLGLAFEGGWDRYVEYDDEVGLG